MSRPQEHGHCADFHPSGAVVAIGTHSGKSVTVSARFSSCNLSPRARRPLFCCLERRISVNDDAYAKDLRCERSNWCLSLRWYVLDAETTDLVAIHTDGNEQLSVMRFSQGELSRLSLSTVTVRWAELHVPEFSSSVCRWQSAGCWISR